MQNRADIECELILGVLKAHCKGEYKIPLPYRQKFSVHKTENESIIKILNSNYETSLKKSELDEYLKLLDTFNIGDVKKMNIAYTQCCTQEYCKVENIEVFYEVDFLLQ